MIINQLLRNYFDHFHLYPYQLSAIHVASLVFFENLKQKFLPI